MKQSKKKILVLALLILISNFVIFNKVQLKPSDTVKFSITVKSDKNDEYQLFYSKDTEFKEENSQKVNYNKEKNEQTLDFIIPKDTKYIRIDPGTNKGNIEISNFKVKQFNKSQNIQLDKNNIVTSNQVKDISFKNNANIITSIGNDPSVVYNLENQKFNVFDDYINNINKIIKIIACIIVDILLFLLIKKSKSVLQLANELNNNKTLIWNLAKNDFKTKYAGSYLGIIWAFINPIITVLIYWFVFQYGLKAGSPVKEASFIYWFMAGLIPWFFFQDGLLNATNCMLEYSYLVKKVVFKISILPIIKIISAIFVHLVFIAFLVFVGILQGEYPDLMFIQLLYYSFCTFFLVLGISYITSSVVLFFRDLTQFINIFLQIGMWMTPIMWSYTIIPTKYQWIAKLNPMYYIVEGYRDTLINKVWFWDRYFQTVYFWIFALIIFIFGSFIFKKLKPHFADVL